MGPDGDADELTLFAQEMTAITTPPLDTEVAHQDADQLLLRLIRHLNSTGPQSPLVDGILSDYEQLERWYS